MNETEIELTKLRERASRLLEAVRERDDEIAILKKALRETGNELCYHCGNYKTAHLGSCDDCRWKNVKSGEMPL